MKIIEFIHQITERLIGGERLSEHERRQLKLYLRLVVAPILADGPGSQKRDEVLSAAFRLFGIDTMWDQANDIQKEEMRREILFLANSDPDPSRVISFEEQTVRLLVRMGPSAVLTTPEKMVLRKWLEDRAQEHGAGINEIWRNHFSKFRAEQLAQISQITEQHFDASQAGGEPESGDPGDPSGASTSKSPETSALSAISNSSPEPVPIQVFETNTESGSDDLPRMTDAKASPDTEPVSDSETEIISHPPTEPEIPAEQTKPKDTTEEPKGTEPAPKPIRVLEISFDDEEVSTLRDRVSKARDWTALAERVIGDAEHFFRNSKVPPMAFNEHRESRDQLVVIVPEITDITEVWFIGDLHGDLLALEAALLHIEKYADDEKSVVVFLGDFVDDGFDGISVFLRVIEEILRNHARLCLLTGNHDEALTFDDDRKLFRSLVSPSEFTDWLNLKSDSKLARRCGRLFAKIFCSTPRAIFLPGGLFAAHGGIPHTDLHEMIKTTADLNDPSCLRDFVWTRAHKRARRKIPNRCSKGCQFGFEDFFKFCEVAQKAIGQPVTRMIRGHDHIEERFCQYDKYDYRLLTINTLSHRLTREYFGKYNRAPCVALFRPSEQSLEVRRLMLSDELIPEIYPEPLLYEEDCEAGQ